MEISMTYKVVLGLIGFVIVAGFWLNFTAKLDKERMSVEYCWDDKGQHYVAPDPHCTH